MTTIPVYKPLLPTAAQIYPYLERIDVNRYYTNRGPLLKEFEEQLASHFSVSPSEIVTSANGTLALAQILKALDVPPQSLCVMPAWTFVATPAAAVAANLIPYFIDVDRNQWAIQPADILPLIHTHTIGAVIVVSAFGCPLNLEEWETFSVNTGIPVIIDMAAGFDSLAISQRLRKTTLPCMVSLHATKTFGIGEGAVIIAGNTKLAKKIHLYGNFGFNGNREASIPGINTKLSEYAAAVGLASLQEWPHKRQSWRKLSCRFKALVATTSEIECSPGFNEGWVSSYGLIKVKSPLTVDYLKHKLEQEGINTVLWWDKGCHTHPAYKNYPRSNLSTTDFLAEHVIGLPFWIGLQDHELERIFMTLHAILEAHPQKSIRYA